MRHVAARERVSRARIAAETGLTRGTVSSLVGELVELGLLHETGEPTEPARVGRPGLGLEMGQGVVGVGLEANVDSLAVSVQDLRGCVRFERRVLRQNRDSMPGPVLDELAALGSEAIETCEEQGLGVAGLAVAVPGLVEIDSGRLRRAPNLRWSDLDVAGELRERIDGCPDVQVENESNLAAVAEQWLGAARGLRDFVFVFGGVGVGGGIVVGGELFRGAHGFGGEIGHTAVVPGGELCACGSRGCLEAYAGLDAIARRSGVAIAGERTQSLALELARRADSGCPDVLAALAEAGRHLGRAAASTVNLFDVDAAVLGGCFGILYPWLATEVEDSFREHLLGRDWSVCDVRASALGEHGAVRGAAAYAVRRVLDAPWILSAPRLEAAV